MIGKERDSDGNLVNVGNFDADGANMNRWNPDNTNDGLGVLLSRSVDNGNANILPSIRGSMFVIYVRKGSYPSTKHASNLIQFFLNLDVVRFFDYFKGVCESNEDFDRVQRRGECYQSFAFLIRCKVFYLCNSDEELHKKSKNLIPDGIAIKLRESLCRFIPQTREIIGSREDCNLRLLGGGNI